MRKKNANWVRQSRSGQALLLTVMLIATAITIVLALSFKSTNQAQVTKLEEDSSKGLAAAEAGVEQALATRQINQPNGVITGISGFSGNYTITSAAAGTSYVSPLMTQDQQYTLYMTTYDESQIAAGHSPFTGSGYPTSGSDNLTIYYGSAGQSCGSIALEVTLIYWNNATAVRRYVADASPGGNGQFGNNVGNIGTSTPGSVGTVSFNCSTTPIALAAGSPVKLILVRSFYTSTKLGFTVAGLPTQSIPAQGKTIISNVTAQGGTSKKVQLFQSFPQIPTDFFVTQFGAVSGT